MLDGVCTVNYSDCSDEEVHMAEQDVIRVARGIVDAFNASDWERCKAAMTSDSVYDEVATSRTL